MAAFAFLRLLLLLFLACWHEVSGDFCPVSSYYETACNFFAPSCEPNEVYNSTSCTTSSGWPGIKRTCAIVTWVCCEGFTGTNCDECIPKANCENGYCVNPGDCYCDPSWTGPFCNQTLYPSISSMSPTSVNSGSSTVVVISGSNLGDDPVVTVEGVTATIVSPWSSISVGFVAPPGSGVGHVVSFTTRYETSPDVFTEARAAIGVTPVLGYNAPSITSLYALEYSTQGFVLSIEGSSFTSAPTVQLDSVPISIDSVTSDHTLIKVPIPAGQGTHQIQVLSLDGRGTSVRSFTFAVPHIESLSPAVNVPTIVSYLTITGSNFATPSPLNNVTLADSELCAFNATDTNQAWTHTLIICQLPEGVGTQTIKVFVGTSVSASNSLTRKRPAISSLSPSSADTIGGIDVVVSGTSFGPPGSASLLFNSVPIPSEHTQTSLTFRLPAGQGSSVPVKVSVGGQQSDAASFRFTIPRITSVAPAVGPTAGGTILSIDGFSFGLTDAATVSLGSKPCAVIASNHFAINCTLPPGDGLDKNLIVSVANQDSIRNTAFSYAAPSVESIWPLTSPTAGGTLLTVFGSSFGFTPAVTVDGKACPVVSAQSNHTHIICTIPAGQGINLNVKVTTASGSHTSPVKFTYAPPWITAVSPPNGTTSGGRLITITGVNFGFVRGAVTLGGVDCPFDATSSWTDTVIVFPTIAGQGEDIGVVVQALGQSSDYQPNPNALFSYLPPAVTSFSISSDYTEGGDTLVIIGSSFGSAGSVTIGSQACEIPGYTHQQISCTVPPGHGTDLSITITQDGALSSVYPVAFSYLPPVISGSPTPSNGLTQGGYNITIAGHSFGSPGLLRFGSGSCAAIPVWTHTQIICTVPPGSGLVTITVAAGHDLTTFSNPTSFQYSVGYVTGISPAFLPTNGSLPLIISGANFGVSAPTVTIRIETAPNVLTLIACPVTDFQFDTITCDTPEGHGKNLQVVVTLDSGDVLTSKMSYATPSMRALSPSTGTAGGNTTVVLTGENFGINPKVTLNGIVATIASRSHSSVTIRTPPGFGTSLPVVIIANVATTTAVASNALLFSYAPPAISLVSPASGPSGGGINITVTGDSFGGTGTVTVGSNLCVVTAWSNDIIICELPPLSTGSGNERAVQVTAGGRSSKSYSFFYQTPFVSSIDPPNGTTSGLYNLTISGLGFGISGAFVVVGDQICTVLEQTNTLLICSVPPGLNRNQAVVVSSSGQTSNSNVTFHYNAPSINSVTSVPAEGSTMGGITVTIQGFSFGAFANVVKIGSWQCSVNSWSHTQVLCKLPPGQGASLPVEIKAGTQVSAQVAGVTKYSYAAPRILGVIIKDTNTQGQDLLTIQGENFGLSGAAYVGSGVCLTVGDYGHRTIICKTPEGEGRNHLIHVVSAARDTADNPLSSSFYFHYSPPTISSVTPALHDTTGGLNVTVIGANFGPSSGSHEITLAGSPVTVLSYTHTEAVFVCPVGTGKDHDIVLSVASQEATAVAALSYNPPSITTVSGCSGENPTINCVSPNDITIVGTNFGNNSLVVDVTVLTPCLSLILHTPFTTLICTLPDQTDSGSLLPVIVTVDSQSDSKNYVSYAWPTISTVEPASIAATDTLTITGQFFGVISTDVSVHFGPSGYDFYEKPFLCDAPSVTSDRITCTVPVGCGGNFVTQVKVAERYSVDSVDTVSYAAPEIIGSTLRRAGGGSGSNELRLTKQIERIQFDVSNIDACNPHDEYLSISYTNGNNTYTCSDPTYETASSVSCVTAKGFGDEFVFTLAVLGQSSAAGTDLLYYPAVPEITSVSGCTADGKRTVSCPTIGGTTITVIGNKFANSGASVKVGSAECSNPRVVSPTIVQCVLPAGTGLRQKVTIQFGELVSAGVDYLSYKAATITGITGCPGTGTWATDCSRISSTTTELSGTNFGAIGGTVLVGGTTCTQVTHSATTPHSKLTCLLPPGTITNQAVYFFQNNGPISSNAGSVSYKQCAAGTFALPGVATCSSCDPGTYSDTVGQTGCKDCAPGFAAVNAGSSSCQRCSAGTASSADGAACNPCLAGQYTPFPGSASCIQCPPGTFSNKTGQSACTECQPGEYAESVGQIECQKCSPGQFAASAKSASCSLCPVGQFAASEGSDACELCSEGSYAAEAGSATCTACPKGSFVAATGQGVCTFCRDGTIANETGMIGCWDCPAGSVSSQSSDTEGPSFCTQCPIGHFTNVAGQGTCQPCPEGTFSTVTGATVCQSCTAGTFNSRTAQTRCTDCPAGQISITSGAVQCSGCNAGTYAASAGLSACARCQPGWHQPLTGQSQCTECAVGYYQPSYAQPYCFKCPAGYFSNQVGALQCSPCGPGEFAASPGITQCTKCPLGSYQLASAASVCRLCPAGQFGDDTGLVVCKACAPGSYTAQSGRTECTACNAGTVSAITGATSCSVCPTGSVSTSSSAINCTLCAAGKFSGTASSCTNCAVGFFSANPGSSICTRCAAGSYSASPGSFSCIECGYGTAQAETGQSKCTDCVAGEYMPHKGQDRCLSCPLGTISNTSAAVACYKCPVGTAGPAVRSSVCQICQAGTYNNIEGATKCTSCAVGFFANTSSSSTCMQCPAGTYQSAVGKSMCIDCPSGTYSAAGAAFCIDCPAGSYSDATKQTACKRCSSGYFSGSAGASQCSACATGSFASSTGSLFCLLCPPGSYSNAPAAVNCKYCPTGFFSSQSGAIQCTDCPIGTFAAYQGHSVCKNCPAGQYASNTQQTACKDCVPGSFTNENAGFVACTKCSAGYFASGYGQTLCTQCAAGYYSNATGASACTLCEVGTFAASKGRTLCTSCQAGSYSPSPGNTICSDCAVGTYAASTGSSFCTNCPAGYYRTSDINPAACVACPAGTYTALKGSASCESCPQGTFSAAAGSSACTSCAAGSFQDVTGSTACKACPAGTYSNSRSPYCIDCTPGFFSPAASSNSCTPCPSGSYAANSRTTACLKCSVGYYSPTAASLSCSMCPPGRYSATPGATVCLKCAQGYKQPSSASAACIPCQEGRYVNSTGQLFCFKCLPGTYQNQFASAVCKQCPAGSYSPDAGLSSCLPCEPGSFTNTTGTAYECTLCAKGRYQSSNGSQVCIDCAPGTFATDEGSAACVKCPAGKEAPNDASKSCVDCVPGYYSPAPGTPACIACPAGTQQPAVGRSVCVDCRNGTFSSSPGSKQCNSCPTGYFGNSTGLAACYPCAPGYYSDATGTTICKKCPAGYFTGISGLAVCLPCPKGSFAASSGASQCQLCAVGYYSNRAGADACLPCAVGQFAAQSGAETCSACPPGQFSSQSAASSCESCPTGFKSENFGASNCTRCDIGSYAPNTGQSYCIDCPAGKFGNRTGLSQCVDCAAGYFSHSAGLSACSPCFEGTFASTAGAVTCAKCPSRAIAPNMATVNCTSCDWFASQANDNRTSCECESGYAERFDQDLNRVVCAKCPRGAVCDKPGTKWDSMPTRNGYWGSPNTTYYLCLQELHCEGGLENKCAPNRYGPLCAKCKDGYSDGLGGSCIKCPSKGGSWTLFVAVIIISIAIMWGMMYVVVSAGESLMRKAELDVMRRKQVADGFVGDHLIQQQGLRHGDVVSIYGPPPPKPNLTFKMKILLGFVQILTNLAISVEAEWPEFFVVFASWLNPANLDFVQISSMDCIGDFDFYDKLVVFSLFPMVFCALLYLLYLLPRHIKYANDRAMQKVSRRKFWKLFLFTLFLIYPSVSSTVLRVYACKTVLGTDYLIADFSLECFTSQWSFYSAYSAIMIFVYPIGIPAFMFIMLWRYRHRLNELAVIGQLGFLFDGYERAYWWFEMVDMLHKLILTSTIVFFPQNMQMVFAICVAWAYTFVILFLRPHLRKGDDRLHLLVQAEIILILICGFTFQKTGDYDSFLESMLGVLLIGLVVGLFLFFVLQALRILTKMWKVKKLEEQKRKKGLTDAEIAEEAANRNLKLDANQIHIRHVEPGVNLGERMTVVRNPLVQVEMSAMRQEEPEEVDGADNEPPVRRVRSARAVFDEEEEDNEQSQ